MQNFTIKVSSCLSELIENPFVKKPYEQLEKLYLEHGFIVEANAIRYLIRQKFDEKSTDNLPID